MAVSFVSNDPRHPQALGAQILVTYSDNSKRAYELGTNTGYLSQSEPTLYLGYTATNKPEQIEIRWPNGEKSRSLIEITKSKLLIEQPSNLITQ